MADIVREMAERLARGPVDLGDERYVMSALQRHGYAAADIIMHSDAAIEMARFYRHATDLGEVA
jgi:hypothetical protein